MTVTAEHALLLALAETMTPHLNGGSSYALAEVIEAGGLDRAVKIEFSDSRIQRRYEEAVKNLTDERVAYWTGELERLADDGVFMVDVSEDAYPVNLRMIHNHPPFLMVRGSLGPDDDRAVAVVGTRQATPEGCKTAFRLAQELAHRNVTVVSGLAAGVDSAAHAGALDASGRTVAVFGTGIDRVYPAKNRALARAVANSGACVSQFLPAMTGARWSFPARNLVTSGMSLGTAVVEASETSGARLQAEAAVRHGKRVFLMRQLIESQQWARDISKRPAVVIADSIDDVVGAIEVDLLDDAVLA